MSVIRFTCLLILLLAVAIHFSDSNPEPEDFYASISGMENLLELENHLLDNLKDYVNRELAKHQRLNLILEYFEKEDEMALKKVGEYFGSPINVFRTMKRSVVDLKDLEANIFEWSNLLDYDLNLTKIVTTLELPLPTSDDLKGAIFGLERLQNTYKLNATDLVEGRLLGVQISPAMGVGDAFVIAKELLEAKRFESSLEWMSVAFGKVNNQSSAELTFIDEVAILDVFSLVAYRAGKLQMALDLTKQRLWFEPRNAEAQADLKTVQMEIFKEKNARKPRSKAKGSPKVTIPQLYEATCRGELKQNPTEQRPLRCMYVNNNVPFLKIAPFKLEQLNLEPFVAYFHETIYENEINKVLEVSTPQLYRSEVGENTNRRVSTYRTSKNTWLEFHEHDFLANIEQRLVDMTQLTLDSAEDLQVANYGIGGHYSSHYDFSTKPEEAYDQWEGNRIATALFYISDVELGGATAFPRLKLAVKPIKGSMVFWYNLHNSTDPDFRMIHAGCPVLKGSKWILNEWIHAGGQEFRRPCGLKSTKYLSEEFEVR